MSAPDRTARRQDVRHAAVAAIVAAATSAGINVFAANDWPTDAFDFPAMLVATPHSQKESLGATVPQFNTVVRLVVIGRVQCDDPDDAQDAIEALADQIEDALLTGVPLVALVQEFLSVETSIALSAEGEMHVGEVAVVAACQIYELFEAPPGELLTEFDLELDPTDPAETCGTADPVRLAIQLPQ